jgi:enolase-phosphatase E1
VTAVPEGGVRSILLDIEGTTTPISFVYDVLFPYVRTNVRRHLDRHGDEPGYRVLLAELRQDHAANHAAGLGVPPWPETPSSSGVASVACYVEWLMDRDSKTGPLKQLQGRIWDDGYARGELTGEVFHDVRPAFARWRDRGLSIGIFSSGSVLAQQLLFRHSTAGDLTPFLRWYFDISVGVKTRAESYERIATNIGAPAPSVLFISDVIAELDAARSAGMDTRLALRPGNKPVADDHTHESISTFDDVRF